MGAGHSREVLGTPTAKTTRVFDIVRRAQQAALSAARPGVPREAVDMHEWPYLVKNNMFGWPKDQTLQPGMVFSDEPGICIKGEFGVRLEDDMHVTDTGAELLTPASPSLEDPFGRA